ncbi:MAG: hypothetical protein LKF01_01195 [Lactobacillus sp.]|jgi:hypothetical protein|nr:hypothetical protein [Lactobacillus sp.]MCH4068155.1 hypothetical protein [Lactobacillus sp.]MCI1304336.1 hypothetical protein [Lactobacillus sp.]MCI1330086.1 hypothetical protein [Lactobacillus sp.]MCI1399685.1 hypothetical protein [Lactobacillus sp.]
MNYLLVNDELKIINHIDKPVFDLYKKIITKMRPLGNLYTTFKIVLIQYQQINELKKVCNRPTQAHITDDQIFAYIQQFSTSYAIFNRMFFDNCRSIGKNYPLIPIFYTLKEYVDDSAERNMKFCRDYAVHSGIPITKPSIVYDILKRQTELHAFIEKDKININNVSKANLRTLKAWDKEIDILPYIDKANICVTTSMLLITEDFIKYYFNTYDIRLLTEFIRKFQKVLLQITNNNIKQRFKIHGVVLQCKDLEQKVFLMNSAALSYFTLAMLNFNKGKL